MTRRPFRRAGHRVPRRPGYRGTGGRLPSRAARAYFCATLSRSSSVQVCTSPFEASSDFVTDGVSCGLAALAFIPECLVGERDRGVKSPISVLFYKMHIALHGNAAVNLRVKDSNREAVFGVPITEIQNCFLCAKVGFGQSPEGQNSPSDFGPSKRSLHRNRNRAMGVDHGHEDPSLQRCLCLSLRHREIGKSSVNKQ